jgi:hypothetical protein
VVGDHDELLQVQGVEELVPGRLAVGEVDLPDDLGVVRGDLLHDFARGIVAVHAEAGRLAPDLPLFILVARSPGIGGLPRDLRSQVVLVGRSVPDPGDADGGMDGTADDLVLGHAVVS